MGFIALLAGFSGVNHAMIFTGGTLIFIAATLLFVQLWNMRGGNAPASLKFYIAGIFYLLVGTYPRQLVGLHVAGLRGPAGGLHPDDHGTRARLAENRHCDLLEHGARRVFPRSRTLAGRQPARDRHGVDPPPRLDNLAHRPDGTRPPIQRTALQRGRLALARFVHLDSASRPHRPADPDSFHRGRTRRSDCASTPGVWLDPAIRHRPHPIHRAANLPQGGESAVGRMLGQSRRHHARRPPDLGQHLHPRSRQGHPVWHRFRALRPCPHPSHERDIRDRAGRFEEARTGVGSRASIHLVSRKRGTRFLREIWFLFSQPACIIPLNYFKEYLMSKSAPARYSSLQVAFHWLTALLIFAAFIFGKYASFLPNDSSEIATLRIHMALGIAILLVIVLRFVTRLRSPRPAYASTGSAFLDGLGKFVHYALYVFIFLMAVSGLALSFQAGLAQIVFGGVGSLPADFFDFAARALHGFIAPALLLLILLHIGGAFYHQLILKDNLIARMSFKK
ncbi:hypothetical protein FBQ79_06735 [Anaerolineae bacterium AMX1]|nr:hypothetical protein [Anaerolineae bacterium AMX1]